MQLGFDGPVELPREPLDRDAARLSVLGKLEGFLGLHANGDEIGLRLRGEQLARGVRFIRIVKEGSYDLVVGNPPYQGTTKMVDAKYVQEEYPEGRHDLYAAFLQRGLQLAREGGVSALLTMRNWMFIKQYADLRKWLLEKWDLRALGDFDRGAFEEVPDEVVSVVVSVFGKREPAREPSIAMMPTRLDDRRRDAARTRRKRAATRVQCGMHTFELATLRIVPEWPIVHWWSGARLQAYASAPKLGEHCPIREGLGTRDDIRFMKRWWEPAISHQWISTDFHSPSGDISWVPIIKGGEDRRWIEPLINLVAWQWRGAAIAHFSRSRFGRGATLYYKQGVAVSVIGAQFGARLHRFSSIIADTGTSAFPQQPQALTATLCSQQLQRIAEELNPSIHFKINDINRLPLFPIANADEIFATIELAFGEHESHREPSIEFRTPGPSPWLAAQAWAQRAVDRPEGAPLTAYTPAYQPEPATDHLSYALGVALGRFHPDGDGILDPAQADLSHALDGGILFLDGTLDENDLRDSLGHPATKPLRTAWAAHRDAIETTRGDLRSWLRLDFFAIHRSTYENRPIHWPLSSSNRTFVAWINIHRWTPQTLQLLLADHLRPLERRIEGELADLRAARDGTDKKAVKAANKQYARLDKYREELAAFITDVEQCSDRGPQQPSDGKCLARETDAPYAPDLDDGVMINSAGLWPLLLPQWKDPKKWWRELANAEGKRDYDWAHLAMRYWPTRVDEKCRIDPSLAVAHGCFWRYHPARAWAWELRLQHDIGPEFRIEEPPYRAPSPTHVELRAAYLREHPSEALEAVEREALRRLRRIEADDQRPIELTILEPGLWSAIPAEVWAMELRLLRRRGCDVRLLAPDELDARAAFEAAHPKLVADRLNELTQLFPRTPDDDEQPSDDEDEPDELVDDD